MADVIQLLPDSVANQIAAGEVVQRPASVVKELLENAVDAGANKVQLIVRDAGKTLIQVIDNGCGMSETDARMSFERHATSKIREAKDLFNLHTFGFRGEALASIAAVAQVEMKTRRATDELGTRLVVEDSFVKIQEPCQTPQGTSIAVKNLFYTVPARKSFLKADPVETRHILDEFQRVAMANPDVFFSLHHNDAEIFHLPVGNLRQRVVKIFGEAVNKKLVPTEQETDILRISGFVGKPDYVKKTRGEQLFFVNKRFIRSNYLHHAVMSAYEDLLPADTYPFYVLFLDIDPGSVDINVHPTKQEIKFDDERLVYNFLKVAVRHALGSHNVTPTLDFEQEPAFQQRLTPAPVLRPERESHSVGTYRPSKFDDDEPTGRHASNLENWEKLYKGLELFEKDSGASQPGQDNTHLPFDDMPPVIARSGVEVLEMDDDAETFSKGQRDPYQIHGQYIISHIKSGFLLIDQQAASERVLYERYLAALENQPIATQKALFPKTIELSAADATLLRDILDEVNCLGFEIAEFGGNTFAIHGSPAELRPGISEEALLQKVLGQYKDNLELQLGARDNLARSMARNASLRKGQPLSVPEMQDLIDRLFACAVPFNSPSGRKCFIQYDLEELQKQFT
ncbi:MAG TPA: DNA mismatch repair endonuclease MutL [Saprospiraceae bacterium]|nr:DNA mismatch repair endonuclease MutL [Saprospiraceae bacterium]